MFARVRRWTLGLVAFGVGPARLTALARGKLKLREIRADVPHGSERYQRLMRAHMNCVENLPVFGSLVVISELVGYRSSTLNGLCCAIIASRVGQSLAHIASARARAVQVRFACFVVQATFMGAIGVMIALHAAGRSS